MANYRRGADFERRVRDMLVDAGWYVVRSAGSHGVADLVILRHGSVRLVSCKSKGYWPKDELTALRDIALVHQVVVWLAYKDGRKITFEVLPLHEERRA